MKKQLLRLYLDTSVFGGVFDEEFQIDSKRIMDALHAKKFLLMMSDVVLDELEGAPENVNSFFCRVASESDFSR